MYTNSENFQTYSAKSAHEPVKFKEQLIQEGCYTTTSILKKKENSLQASSSTHLDDTRKDTCCNNEAGRIKRNMKYEKVRLVDQDTYNLNNSGTKYVSIGLDPLSDFECVLRICRAAHTEFISLNMHQFEEFVVKLPMLINELENDSGNDIILDTVGPYSLYSSINNVLVFKQGNIPKIFLALSSLRTFQLFTELYRQTMDNKINDVNIVTEFCTIDYFSNFILNELYCDRFLKFNIETCTDLIRRKYNNSPHMYELLVKYYHHIENIVSNSINW